MDRIIKKKRWTAKKIALLSVVALGALLLGRLAAGSLGKSTLSVSRERMAIATVKRGKFRELAPVTGAIQPISTIYLDLQEGGRVEEIFVEDGALLKKNQPILKLSNTDLELSLITQETSVYNLLMQMQIAQNNARQNTISKLNQAVDVESLLREAKRVFEMNKKLLAAHAIGRQEYMESENSYRYLVEKQKLTAEVLQQDSIASAQQMEQVAQSYEGAKNGLGLMRRKFSGLTVRAPVDGQLTSLDAEIGQSKNKGERIGQIDVLSGFKVRVDVDEHYIARIYAGLEGQYRQGDSLYTLTIKKVYTQVSGGRFAVDMLFKGAAPDGIRRGQSLQIRIALGDETDAILIPRGGFYQQTGGKWIFALSADGSRAYRKEIRIGRQNPDYYEVLEGLEPNEKVVVNSYENYGDAEELRIEN